MQDNLPNSKDYTIEVIAIYQIIGGIIGLVFQFLLMSKQESSALHIFFALLALFLYSFSIFCGVELFTNKRSSPKFSLLNQYLQLLNFTFLGVGFEYVSGFSQCIGISLTNGFEIKFNSGISTWHVLINGDKEITEIHFNLVALYIIYLLEQFKKKKNNENMKTELYKIGE